VVDGDGLDGVKVEAKVVAHERGPKLRIVKFKPKRGYKRRTGHRQELTRIEVVSLGRAAKRRRKSASKAESAPKAAADPQPSNEQEATDGT
jgi:large subunit ribosomal protein L21